MVEDDILIKDLISMNLSVMGYDVNFLNGA